MGLNKDWRNEWQNPHESTMCSAVSVPQQQIQGGPRVPGKVALCSAAAGCSQSRTGLDGPVLQVLASLL